MKTYLITTLMLITSTSIFAGKWDVNVDVDVHTRTNFRNCETYAESICELTGSYIKAKDEAQRALIAKLIKTMKKSLHTCEKNNKSNTSVDVKAAVSYEF